MIFPLLFSAQALRKGQVIKQFFAYSISESLSKNPFHWISTTVPCHPTRIWVEEPPIFHFLAGLSIRIFGEQSIVVPLLAYALLVLIAFLFSVDLRLERKRWLFVLCVVACPVFLRYSIQHLPDLLATSWLCLASFTLWRKKRKTAILLFTLAATTKALTLFAIGPILLWDLVIRSRKNFWEGAARTTFTLVLIGLPFLVWLGVIFTQKISNPFVFQRLMKNRHSGEYHLLFSLRFWARFFTWVAPKGVGLVLFFLSGFGIWRILRKKSLETLQTMEGLFLCWTAGILPFWILVRQGNFVHDYYSLPFIFPLAALGVLEGYRLEIAPWLRSSILLLNVGIGVWNVSSLKAIPSSGLEDSRPLFCDYETSHQN